jgi:hypothetical protein
MTTHAHGWGLARDEAAVGVTCVVLAVTAALSLHGTLEANGPPRAVTLTVTPIATVSSVSGRSLYADVVDTGGELPEQVAIDTHAPTSARGELSAWVCSRHWVTATGACPGRATLVEAPGAPSRVALVSVPPSMAAGDAAHFRFVLAGPPGNGGGALTLSAVPV